MSVENTLAERGQRYGTFLENATVAQQLKAAMIQGRSWATMPADAREALEVITQKISRIVTGDSSYTDNWHDIQGYAKLVEDRLLADAPKAALPVRKR
jgi:hypothetical protein